jgi:hypothetical protein
MQKHFDLLIIVIVLLIFSIVLYFTDITVDKKDYQLDIQDNGIKLVLYDNGKPVHIFDRANPCDSVIFNVIDRDNW